MRPPVTKADTNITENVIIYTGSYAVKVYLGSINKKSNANTFKTDNTTLYNLLDVFKAAINTPKIYTVMILASPKFIE